MSFKFALLAAALFTSATATAAIRTVATTPDVAWLLHRIGGSEVEVKALARANDNYHFLDARPDFILAVNRASVVCRVGADLEIGWLPKVLERAANSKVMDGGAGDCDLSRAVKIQDKPTGPVDRSMGDTHASGNPHFWLSPAEMLRAATEVETRLAAVAPEKASAFAENRILLEKLVQKATAAAREKLAPVKGKAVVEYHKEFAYFFSEFGLKSAGSIEEIPGVAPSAARLGRVATTAKSNQVVLAVSAPWAPKAVIEKFAEVSGIPFATVPTSITDPKQEGAYEALLVEIATRIAEKAK